MSGVFPYQDSMDWGDDNPFGLGRGRSSVDFSNVATISPGANDTAIVQTTDGNVQVVKVSANNLVDEIFKPTGITP
jgi:hypothetical protein